MRGWALAAALLFSSGCLIDPPEIEGKICDVAKGCPAGFTCVAEAGAEQGVCHSGSGGECVGDAPACELTLGVCTLSQRQCVGGSFEPTCSVASYPPTYEAVELTCRDSLDNDCDGRLDVSWQVRTGPRAVLAYDVRRTVDGGGYVVAAREAAGGGSQIVAYHLSSDLEADGPLMPNVLSATNQVTFGPVVTARQTATGITWAERSLPDAGEEVWFALVDETGTVRTLDGGAEVLRRAVARADLASAPRTAWLSVNPMHLVVWADTQRRLMTVFLDNEGRPTSAGVRALPHTRPLGEVSEAAVAERVKTSDGDGFAIAFSAKDGGQDWIGLRLVTATDLAVDWLTEDLPYPPKGTRIARTYKYGATSNISWYAWYEDRPGNDAVRIRTTYGADTLAEFVPGAGVVKDLELVVTENDKLVLAWSDGATTRFSTSNTVVGSDSVFFASPSFFDGGAPAIAASLESWTLFAARDGGEVWAERRCGP